MAVFRVNKTQDYTVMSNFLLKDKSLSLKSKGFYHSFYPYLGIGTILQEGLAAICKRGHRQHWHGIKGIGISGIYKV